MSKHVGCTPTSSPFELSHTYSSKCIHCMVIPTLSHWYLLMGISIALWYAGSMWPSPLFCLTTSTTLYSTYSAISMAHAHVLRESWKRFEKVRVRKQLLGQYRGCAWFKLVVWGWWSIARLYDFVGIIFFGLVISKVHDYLASLLGVLLFSCQ